MLDEREAPVAAGELSRAFNRKPLWQRTAVVAAGPLANLLLAVLLYACAHWIGVDEPKALLGPLPAGSLAERAGLRSGDWARAVSTDGVDWQDLRSMSDLRWQMTQALLRGESLHLLVADRDGRARSGVPCSTCPRSARPSSMRATLQRVGLGTVFSEPVLGEVRADGPGERAGLRAGDRVLAIDGEAITDAARGARPHPRQRRHRQCAQHGLAGRARRPAPRVHRAAQRRHRRRAAFRPRRTFPRPAARNGDGALRLPRRAVAGRDTHLGHVDADAEDARQDADRRSLAEEPQRPADDRRLRGPVGAPGPGLLPRLPGRGQRESGRAQPAPAAHARWRAPDVLSFRGCDGAACLRVVARQTAARGEWPSCS